MQVAPLLRFALRIIRLIMLPVAIGFLVYFAYDAREALGDVLERASPRHLLLSLILWTSAHFIFPVFSAVFLDRKHHHVRYGVTLRVHAKNLLSRYIPGGVWHTVGRFVDFRHLGMTSRQLSALMFMENSLLASIALGVGGASVWYSRGFGGWGSTGAVGALAGLAGLVLSPIIVNRWVLRGQDRISPVLYAKSVVVLVIFWATAAAAFVSYLNAFAGGLPPMHWLQTGGIYLLSWGLGFVAFFAPQGIGVFEVTLAKLLPTAFSLGAIVVIIGGFRIVIMAADVLVWLVVRFAFPRTGQ